MTTKCRSGLEICRALMTASLPTPLGPLITTFTGCRGGICKYHGAEPVSLHQSAAHSKEPELLCITSRQCAWDMHVGNS